MTTNTRFRNPVFIIALVICVLFAMTDMTFAKTYSKINSIKYFHPVQYRSDDYKVFKGVDVSYWQYGINWKKVKKAGVDYAFIRCGYTASNNFKQHKDSYFAGNMENAIKAGVNVGVYFWSEATTKAEAREEAAYVAKLLEPYKENITMPVIMDYEFASGFRSTIKYNQVVNKKGKAAARKRFTSNAIAFMDAIASYGYTPMFYSYRGLIDPSFNSNYKIDMSRINGKNQYKFWLAQYSTDNSYSGSFEFWQHTSSGKVSGISGRCDRNFWYYNPKTVKTLDGTVSLKDCAVSITNALYNGGIRMPSVKVTYDGKVLKKGKDFQTLYLRNIKMGKATVIVRGIGDYSNEVMKTFRITDKDISDAVVSAISTKIFVGKALKPIPTVKYNGTKLKVGKDFSVSYSNNKNAGTATITITGKGTFAGSKKVTFKIKQGEGTVTTDQDTYTMPADSTMQIDASTNGGKLTYESADPEIASVDEKGLITSGTTAGSTTITIRSAANKNAEAAEKTVTVNVLSPLDKVQITDLTSPDDLTFTVSWNPVESAEGYIVYYSPTKEFKRQKKVLVPGGDTTSVTITSQYKKQRRVVVRVCAFQRTSGGKKSKGEVSNRKGINVISKLPAPEVRDVFKKEITKKVTVKKNGKKKTVKKTVNRLVVKWVPVEGAAGYIIRYSNSKDMKNSKSVKVPGGKSKRVAIKSKYGDDTVYVKIRTIKKLYGVKYYGPLTEETYKVKFK